MRRILVVGNATLDVVNLVENYPREDEEVRALSQYRRRGGNAGNTAVVLSQLGDTVSFAGSLADEPDAEIIREDFRRYAVDLDPVFTVSDGKVPTSYIALCRKTGSRTIVHVRDLPEYPVTAFARIDLKRFDAVHFEGRNVDKVRTMLEHLRKDHPRCVVSIEAEKPRDGIHELYAYADVLLFSRVFAQAQGHDEAAGFLKAVHRSAPHARLACGWGEQGAYAMTPEGEFLFTPAFAPRKVVDTLGAGDVFNAGMIHGCARAEPLEQTLIAAARLAGKKCGQQGFDGLGAEAEWRRA